MRLISAGFDFALCGYWWSWVCFHRASPFFSFPCSYPWSILHWMFLLFLFLFTPFVTDVANIFLVYRLPLNYFYKAFKRSTWLRCNLLIKWSHLKWKVWWVLTNVCTCVTSTTGKIDNIFITLKNSFMFLSSQFPFPLWPQATTDLLSLSL